jgi:hypothetical protein
MQRGLTAFAGVAVCTLGCAALVAAAHGLRPARRADVFGVVTHYWGDVMPQEMQQLGAGWIRAGCRWADVQPTPGPDASTWNWGCPDQVMSATDQGLRVLFGLGGTPPWANGGGADNAPPAPDHLADWYRYCLELMSRYRGRGVVYEVWNEPNLDIFFTGTLDDYLNLARNASLALRAVDPSGALSGPETSNLATQGRASWHDDAVRSLSGILDVVTTHWYCGGHCGTSAQIGAELRAYLAGRGTTLPPGVPLWLTETGLSSPDDAQQAAFYDAVLSAYEANFQDSRRRAPAWQNVFFYHLLADDDATIIRTDPARTPRAAFYRYQYWINQVPHAVRRRAADSRP